jgi:hypothetical protein
VTVRPDETEAEREQRHEASLTAYRSLIDPTQPPKKPFLLEHHFFASDAADVSGFTQAMEGKGYQIDTVSYDPDNFDRTWTVIALRLDLLEEKRILRLSDEMEAASRPFDVVYDGWLTRVE